MILKMNILFLIILYSFANNALGSLREFRYLNIKELNKSSEYSISAHEDKRSGVIEEFRINTVIIDSVVGSSVTLSCSINLDDATFTKSRNYKIIWSRQSVVNKDYEPLFLDETRLVFDKRITANRFYINKIGNIELQWNLFINDLKESDNTIYICQLNQHPYEVYWLKKFRLNIYGRFINYKHLTVKVGI